jgi:hypothetical protein
MKATMKYFISDGIRPCSRFLIASFCFFISCSKPFPESPLLDLVLLQSIQNQLNANSTTTITNTTKYIFVTQATFQGNLGGVSGADTICQNEKENNFSSLAGAKSEYKSLLVDGVARVACLTANCTSTIGNNTNWVLQPNSKYYRPDEQLVFETNGAGIFVFGTLTNAFSTVGTDQWWTGLDTNWTTSGDDCSNWVSNAGGVFALFGLGENTNDSAISDFASTACSNSKKLLCVRN